MAHIAVWDRSLCTIYGACRSLSVKTHRLVVLDSYASPSMIKHHFICWIWICWNAQSGLCIGTGAGILLHLYTSLHHVSPRHPSTDPSDTSSSCPGHRIAAVPQFYLPLLLHVSHWCLSSCLSFTSCLSLITSGNDSMFSWHPSHTLSTPLPLLGTFVANSVWGY